MHQEQASRSILGVNSIAWIIIPNYAIFMPTFKEISVGQDPFEARVTDAAARS